MLTKLVSIGAVSAAMVMPFAVTPAASAAVVIPHPNISSCAVGAKAVELDLLALMGLNSASVPWTASCTYVANGIQTPGHVTASVDQKGGSVTATVQCTLGSGSATQPEPGSSTTYFTHTGTCTLTASGLGYGGASAD